MEAKVERLEKKVKELETRPPVVINPAPVYPLPYPVPMRPLYLHQWEVWYGDITTAPPLNVPTVWCDSDLFTPGSLSVTT